MKTQRIIEVMLGQHTLDPHEYVIQFECQHFTRMGAFEYQQKVSINVDGELIADCTACKSDKPEYGARKTMLGLVIEDEETKQYARFSDNHWPDTILLEVTNGDVIGSANVKPKEIIEVLYNFLRGRK